MKTDDVAKQMAKAFRDKADELERDARDLRRIARVLEGRKEPRRKPRNLKVVKS